MSTIDKSRPPMPVSAAQEGRSLSRARRRPAAVSVTLPGNFGHPRTRGTREDVRHAQKSTTQVHTRAAS